MSLQFTAVLLRIPYGFFSKIFSAAGVLYNRSLEDRSYYFVECVSLNHVNFRLFRSVCKGTNISHPMKDWVREHVEIEKASGVGW